jgi:hypothetical protein
MTHRDIFYIRPWLKSVRDLPLDIDKVAKHIGAAEAYGLYEENFERRMVHYCEQPAKNESIVVNIDPDLMINRLTRRGFLTKDIGDFVSKLQSVHPMGSEEMRRFKKQVASYRKEYENQNLMKRFVQSIPNSLKDSQLSKLRLPTYKAKYQF